MTVSELLTASRAAHAQYRANVAHRLAAGVQPGNPVAARAALEQAATLRKQAEDADPQHVDAAWASDALISDHQQLLTWYAEQLAR